MPCHFNRVIAGVWEDQSLMMEAYISWWRRGEWLVHSTLNGKFDIVSIHAGLLSMCCINLGVLDDGRHISCEQKQGSEIHLLTVTLSQTSSFQCETAWRHFKPASWIHIYRLKHPLTLRILESIHLNHSNDVSFNHSTAATRLIRWKINSCWDVLVKCSVSLHPCWRQASPADWKLIWDQPMFTYCRWTPTSGWWLWARTLWSPCPSGSGSSPAEKHCYPPSDTKTATTRQLNSSTSSIIVSAILWGNVLKFSLLNFMNIYFLLVHSLSAVSNRDI